MNSLKEKKTGIVSQNENIRRGSVLCVPIIGTCFSGHITLDKGEIKDLPKSRQGEAPFIRKTLAEIVLSLKVRA